MSDQDATALGSDTSGSLCKNGPALRKGGVLNSVEENISRRCEGW